MDARLQSPGEEIANSLIHGIALLAVAIAVPVLIVTAVRHGGTVNVAAASVFATTMILLYLTSTVYHALPASRAKRLFLTLDRHCRHRLPLLRGPGLCRAMSHDLGKSAFGDDALEGLVARAKHPSRALIQKGV
jgi:hypothetical protein